MHSDSIEKESTLGLPHLDQKPLFQFPDVSEFYQMCLADQPKPAGLLNRLFNPVLLQQKTAADENVSRNNSAQLKFFMKGSQTVRMKSAAQRRRGEFTASFMAALHDCL